MSARAIDLPQSVASVMLIAWSVPTLVGKPTVARRHVSAVVPAEQCCGFQQASSPVGNVGRDPDKLFNDSRGRLRGVRNLEDDQQTNSVSGVGWHGAGVACTVSWTLPRMKNSGQSLSRSTRRKQALSGSSHPSQTLSTYPHSRDAGPNPAGGAVECKRQHVWNYRIHRSFTPVVGVRYFRYRDPHVRFARTSGAGRFGSLGRR